MKLEDMRANAREGKPIDLDRDAAERLRKSIELAKQDPEAFLRLLDKHVPPMAFKLPDLPRNDDGSYRLRVYADTRKWFRSNITPAIYMAGV